MTDEFKIRTYSKKELALLYFPDSSPPCAVNHLMAWVKRNEPLRRRLSADGYRKTSKAFTPKQVRAVVECLGPP